MIPTLFTLYIAQPAGGAGLAWGGPALRPTLVTFAGVGE